MLGVECAAKGGVRDGGSVRIEKAEVREWRQSKMVTSSIIVVVLFFGGGYRLATSLTYLRV